MEFLQTISGGAPVIKRYQAGAAITTAGVPVVTCSAATTASNLAAVTPISASAASAPIVGLALDTAPDVAATGLTTASDILVSVVINPDAVLRAKLSGGTAADTELSLTATTAADTTGATATGTTTLDDGALWGYDGANAGIVRRADDTSGSVSMNFPHAIASGDQFIASPAFPLAVGIASANKFVDLTASLTQIDASATVTDTDNFVVVDLEANDIGNDGQNNSFYHLLANDHALGGNAQRS